MTEVCPAVSVSIGIASFPDDGLAARDLALAAERALLRATELGGNRTLLYSSREDVPASWKVTSGDEHADVA